MYKKTLINLIVLFLPCLVLPSTHLKAQAAAELSPHALSAIYYPRLPSTSFTFTQGLDSWRLGIPPLSDTNPSSAPPTLRSGLHTTNTSLPSFNPDHLAFFCRLEVRLEKATKIPVRFRLGDVQQVDYLEGKFTGWRYGY